MILTIPDSCTGNDQSDTIESNLATANVHSTLSACEPSLGVGLCQTPFECTCGQRRPDDPSPLHRQSHWGSRHRPSIDKFMLLSKRQHNRYPTVVFNVRLGTWFIHDCATYTMDRDGIELSANVCEKTGRELGNVRRKAMWGGRSTNQQNKRTPSHTLTNKIKYWSALGDR